MSLHVWLLASTFEPRGRSKYTLRLAEHLPKFGIEPTIICQSANHIPASTRRSLRIREIPFLNHPFLGYFAKQQALAEAELNPPDLIHGQRKTVDSLAGYLADELGKPYLLTIHSSLAANADFDLAPRFFGGLIAISSSVRRELILTSGFVDEKVYLIQSGIDLPEDPVLPRHRAGKGVPFVGCAGPLEPSKGMTYFLMAAELILSSGQDVEFVVAGSGPEEPVLRRLATHLDIANRVTFATHVDDFRSILENIDVFAFTSLEQGLGTIMLEAMASGTPVVSTDVEGVTEFFLDQIHALLVPRSNHVLLAEKIQDLLDNPDRARKLAISAQELVRRKFSAHEMAEKTAKLYFETVKTVPVASNIPRPPNAFSPR